jgi:RNA polymerase sigma-70 factor (ECF subfamily)
VPGGIYSSVMLASRSLHAEPQPLTVVGVTVAGSSIGSADQANTQRRVALVRAHLRDVWNFLRRVGLSPEDADDAAQEVFLVAMDKFDRLEPGRERAFLFGIALRVASRSRRSSKSRAEKTVGEFDIEECLSTDPSSYELVARKQARELLDRALSEMKPELRNAFVLFELEELTMVEIAALTDVPLGTVASRIWRAREQFLQATKRMQSPRQR